MFLNKTIFLKSLLFIQIAFFAGKAFTQPIADFSGTPVTGCAPLLVNFTDLSTGAPTSWKWDLGNGTISTLQSPSVTYFTSGKYKITLTVKNAAGSNTIVRDQYIDVLLNPAANFAGGPTSGCLPLPVKLTDQSVAGSGILSSWKWDFGDGLIDSVQNPTHSYKSSGTFDITLQVKNSFGCIGTVSKSKYINTSNSVVADFTNNFPSSCKPPVTLNFKNLSTGPSLSYKWDFGDGTTSTATNPSHTYSSAGTFSAQLITLSAGGCSGTVRKNIIVGSVSADFSSPPSVCPGKSFSLTNSSSPAPSNVLWDFGDGTIANVLNPSKIYSTPGIFSIKMIADFGACKDSVSKSITVLPKQNLSFIADDSTSCKAPFTVNFKSNPPGAASYFWNFGDGAATSTLPNPSHTYNFASLFNVSLFTTSSAGCRDTLVKLRYIQIQPTTVSLPDLPQKNCLPFTYVFSAKVNSVDSVVKYAWNFGDGTTSNLANPSHTFSVEGSYTISVTITTNSGCTATTQVAGGVVVGNKPVANFKGAPLVACASVPIDFTDLSTGNITEWLWDFGDSTTSILQNPSHNYSDSGFFKVKLLVRSNGCPDSISFPNYVYIKPGISKFYIKANCTTPVNKTFVDSSKNANKWQWDFGDGSPISTLRNPKHIYPDTGTYTVSLKITNLANGCTHTSMKKALVIDEKPMYVASATDICKNAVIQLKQQNVKSSNIVIFNWQFGDGTSGSTYPDSVLHQYTNIGTYTTKLIITDLLGCKDTLTKSMHIKVGGPTANFSSNPPGTCVNSILTFIDASTSDGIHPIVKWTWDYGDNTTEVLTGPPFIHIYKSEGAYTVKVKVLDSNGCLDSLIRTNYITISKLVTDFTADDSASCPLATVQFTSSSNGINPVYLWNFGDGSSSNNPNPVHQYTTTGMFTVQLKITDQFGCADSLTKNNYINITTPAANFKLSDSISACPPFFLTLVNTSVNADSLLWDFGDGNFSSAINPTHFYYIPGNYVVRLRATGPGGCFDEKTANIVVKGPNGVLSYTNVTGCNNLKTDFKATSKNNLLFTWDFNDGTIIKTKDSSISHVYAEVGFYIPKLILEDANGCQVPIRGIDTIKVIGIKAGFDGLPSQLCDAGIVTFTDTSLSNEPVTGWQWNFGDGTTSAQQNPAHNFTAPGIYSIGLISTSANGCKDTALTNNYIKIVARPNINISGSAAACQSDTLTFKGNFLQPDTSIVTWKWDFGNGQNSFLQDPPAQTYSTMGRYTINAVATNSSGCSDTATQTVIINPLPPINAGNDAFLCLGTPVQLQASGASSYQWIAPSNFLSCTNCSNPFTSTPDDITYIVKGTNGFNCIAFDSVTIRVKKPFTISLTPDADSICIGQSIQLNSSYAENYLWSPVAGLNNSTIRNPLSSPNINTTYKVIGYDSGNCFKDSAFVNISVFSYPSVDAGPNKSSKSGEPITLSPVYSNDVIDWLWTPGKGLSCNTCPSPVAMPDANTTYTIKVENSGGCSATDEVTIFTVCNNENIFIPNTFSPNGDGVNDIFYPRGTGINRIRGMKIFNRWGQLVYEKSNFYANDPESGWTGLVGGKKVPSDVYTYMIDIICENGNVFSQSGNITLLK